MSHYLRYDLEQGFVHNWLVAGPFDDRPLDADCDTLMIEGEPTEQAMTPVRFGNHSLGEVKWRYLHSAGDHLLDPWQGRRPGREACWSLAACQVEAKGEQLVDVTLYATGAARLWLNGALVLKREAGTSWLEPTTASLTLPEGQNQIVALSEKGAEHTWEAMALCISGQGQSPIQVVLPTESRFYRKQPVIERFAEEAYIQRDVFAAEDHIIVKWPGASKSEQEVLVRVQRPTGEVHAQAQPQAKALQVFEFSEAMSARDGRYLLRIGAEYDDLVHGLLAYRDTDIYLLHVDHTSEPESDRAGRTDEMLKHAVWWISGLYAEVAKTALDWWDQIDSLVIQQAGDAVARRLPGWEHDLVGLALLAHRSLGRDELSDEVRDALWQILDGADYTVGASLDSDKGILCLASAMLAQGLIPDLAERLDWAEEMTWRWLRRRAAGGFASWHSSEALEAVVLGLVALIDHAEDDALTEMAATVLDKALYTVALNSFQGVCGASGGDGDAMSILDGRLCATSPLSRLLWGVGCWNQHMGAAVVLGSSAAYEYPSLFQPIALSVDGPLWTRERHVTAWGQKDAVDKAAAFVNVVNYRRPEYMLSSAQSHRPGQAGASEQIWQAALGPKTLIHVNHPGNLGQRDNGEPGFWRGNVALPRVAQHKNLLLALHRLPDDDWMGFTHAHFPVAELDEYSIRQDWAFARKGDAYLAITASTGIRLVRSGPGAYRELRSFGQETVWVCQLGCATEDESMEAFTRKVLSSKLDVDGLSVCYESADHGLVSFGWEEPFVVGGVEQPLEGYSHYKGPYCTCALGDSVMEVQQGGWMLRLEMGDMNT